MHYGHLLRAVGRRRGLDEPVFRRHIRSLLERGTKHLYVFGTAGEGYAVDDEQFDRITTVFSEEMRAGGAEPMVGIISLSLSTVIRRIERACERGIQRFQISLPSWGACTPKETFAFFKETCGQFPDRQFMHTT